MGVVIRCNFGQLLVFWMEGYGGGILCDFISMLLVCYSGA